MLMRFGISAFVVFAIAGMVSIPAQAGVVVTIDQAAQRLSVSVDGFDRFEWKVSTARWGYHTPNGTYRPQWLARNWASRMYGMAPMPYSIFFNGGYAIHGTTEVANLGTPASHGCVRLRPDNAAILFDLVKANMKDTQIVVTGERPAPPARERTVRQRGGQAARSADSERRSTWDPDANLTGRRMGDW